MKNSIAVIGQGFVGGSLTTVFYERGVDVYAYDKAGKYAQGALPCARAYFDRCMGEARTTYISNERKLPTSISHLVKECEESVNGFSKIYFVCLPTPMYEDGAADVSIVESALQELANMPGDRIAVVKSTVPPGTIEEWNRKFNKDKLYVIFNPEFLTEANALNDMRNQNRVILGGPRPHINQVKQLFEQVFTDVPVIKTSSTTAEMVKYVTNIHLAAKVSLANEFQQICVALDNQGKDIDYDKVIEYALHDERLGKSHWKVPGPDGNPGFGGHCFPKDLNGLIALAKSLNVTPTMMQAAWEKNNEIRNNRDWEKMDGRAVSKRKT